MANALIGLAYAVVAGGPNRVNREYMKCHYFK